ncbi:hypothetical protein K469DRAFT_683157 [Zopfia rhizophila CBS 207.26]|uniref:Uncharacterized protein n=1 Tax=Zopfia rhizophila CBS 207.26 TaxID=1314779 RepID=A0A6A6EER4_9PEZI|nr:hypothetical protein K469DRAFT_683157 [Zopfia rhizophila CBS 207.26]
MSSTGTPSIAVEEFYLSPEANTTCALPDDPVISVIPSAILSKLKNVGFPRIRDMRSTSVSMQVLSHLPIAATTKRCQKINNMLHSAIPTNPTALPPSLFCRVRVATTKWRMSSSSLCNQDKYSANYPASYFFSLVTTLYPYHISSPVFILRLYASGIFDRYHNLRSVVSKMGVGIPPLVPKIESMVASWNQPNKTEQRYCKPSTSPWMSGSKTFMLRRVIC